MPRRIVDVGTTAGVALACLGISSLFPFVSAVICALLVGCVVANTRLGRTRLGDVGAVAKVFLRGGVALLGLKVSATGLADLGAPAMVVVVLTVSITFFITIATGRWLGVDPGLTTLIAAGFSICGAAAVAAFEGSLRTPPRDAARAVALVTVFGTGMIAAIPLLASWWGFGERQTAVWVGASIHEVAQVVASASLVGGGAVAIATIVKLGRVMMLAPMCVVVQRRQSRSGRDSVPVVPWFIVAFMMFVVIRSIHLVPSSTYQVADVVTTALLAGGMFGLGLGVRWRDLWPLPARLVLLAVVATTVVTVLPAFIVWCWI